MDRRDGCCVLRAATHQRGASARAVASRETNRCSRRTTGVTYQEFEFFEIWLTKTAHTWRKKNMKSRTNQAALRLISVIIISVAVSFPNELLGQEARGTISGRVTDPAKAVI